MTVDPISAPEVGRKNRYLVSLAALSTLFFMWGAITSLNDILLPHLKAAFDLNYTQATLIQFTFFTAYFLVSLPAGQLIQRIGYKQGIMAGLAVAAVGCGLFYPAAEMRVYPVFLGALFILASGITVLQVSANAYVAIIGPPETAPARLNQTQALNSLGTTVAPYLGAVLILGAGRGDAEAGGAASLTDVSAVTGPYLGLAATLLAIALLIFVIPLPRIAAAEDPAGAAGDGEGGNSIWRHPHLLLGAGAIFLYVGGEVSIGSFLVSFMSQPEIGNLPAAVAGKYLSYYWGGAMVGRFIGAALLTRVDAGRALAVNAAAAMLLVTVAVVSSGPAAMWALLAVGLCNSIMFPTIFTLGINALGPLTARGSGVLCMAIVGGAVVPLVQGTLADRIGLHLSFVIPALCYLYIVHYGAKGHVPRPVGRQV